MDLLVAYDIANTEHQGGPRLRKVHDICSSYCHKVQFSVFECRLSAQRLARLIGELEDAIDPAEDSILIYRLDNDPAKIRTELGRPAPRRLGDPWIL